MNTNELTFELLCESLDVNFGILNSTRNYLLTVHKVDVSVSTIRSKIKLWGMEEYLVECRIRGVEEALYKRFSQGIKDGDNTALTWILNKYGHHADFLKPLEENNLEFSKGDISAFFKSIDAESKSETKD